MAGEKNKKAERNEDSGFAVFPAKRLKPEYFYKAGFLKKERCVPRLDFSPAFFYKSLMHPGWVSI